MMAPTAPGAVEFHIHHVVPAFQINMLSNAKRKKRILFSSLLANTNNGTQAIKIKGENPASGQAQTSNRPDKRLNNRGEIFFKKRIMFMGRQVRQKRDKNRLKMGKAVGCNV
jgi:hypothetical protein